jgi:hypothetical protein
MNPQMDVLYLKDLGHVLAAFTRVSEPDQIEASAMAFIGDGLHLRGLGTPANYAPSATNADFNTQDFVVPPSHIALTRVDLNPSQLAAPRDQYVTISNTPPTVSLFANSPPVIAISPLKITLAHAIATDTPFLILIEGQALGSPIEQPCTFPAGPAGSTFTPNLPAVSTLSPGTYYAVVFVPAYPIDVHFFTVP